VNQRPLGYEPIAGLHALQRATALRRENARLLPSTLAPAVGRWRQFSRRNPVADRPSARGAYNMNDLRPLSTPRGPRPCDISGLLGRSSLEQDATAQRPWSAEILLRGPGFPWSTLRRGYVLYSLPSCMGRAGAPASGQAMMAPTLPMGGLRFWRKWLLGLVVLRYLRSCLCSSWRPRRRPRIPSRPGLRSSREVISR
jgi:hypothetical protein